MACLDNPAAHSTSKKKERQTIKEMGGQHIQEWTGMTLGATTRKVDREARDMGELVAKSSVAPQRSTRLRDG